MLQPVYSHLANPTIIVQQHNQSASIIYPRVFLFQSWRLRVYLLQVLHLCLWHFYLIYNRLKTRHFPFRVYPTRDTIIDGDPSIKELWKPLKIDGEPVLGLPGDSRTVFISFYFHKRFYSCKQVANPIFHHGILRQSCDGLTVWIDTMKLDACWTCRGNLCVQEFTWPCGTGRSDSSTDPVASRDRTRLQLGKQE